MKRITRGAFSFFRAATRMRGIFLWYFFGVMSVAFMGACSRQPVTRTFVAAGTYLEIKSPDIRAAGIVYEEFKRLEDIFNFYSLDSELSQLNRTYQRPVKVSSELLKVLTLAREVTQKTSGAFDASYGALYARWKECIKKGTGDFPQEKEIVELRELGGMRNIEINQGSGTVTIKKEGLKIDLGGIAEGYMVDRAVEKLKAAGITSALINAGGDIYCMGTNAGKPWVVGIKDPQRLARIFHAQKLVDEAVTTSGSYEQFFQQGRKRFSHLIDPRTGSPVQSNVVSVSVIAKDCIVADSLATAFFVMGLEATKVYINAYPRGMRVFFLTSENGIERMETVE